MCLSKYSNLDLLKEVVSNLCLSDDHRYINGLSERELSALINRFYQRKEVDHTFSGEKRKGEDDTCSDNKKLRIFNKPNILSALELVPNEVFEIILKGVGGEDKKNLRITSKRLFDKTTLMAPMFKNWGFEANKGIQPDFVLKSEKNFHIGKNTGIGPIPSKNLVNYVNRISALQINHEGTLMEFLNTYPAKFTQLTSLDLDSVYFDNDALLKLAPQLEYLRLASLRYCYKYEDEEDDEENEYPPLFNLDTVDENSDCFTKIKTLKIEGNIEIDMTKILTKCCKTLEHLTLEFSPFPESCLIDLQHKLHSLNSLNITSDHNRYEPSLKNLLSLCSGSLRTLKLFLHYKTANTDFSSLLEQTLKITTLEISPCFYVPHIEKFLNKCPLIQNLTLIGHEKEVNGLELKDLRKLELAICKAECVTSVLKCASKSSIMTLYLFDCETTDCELPVIQELDTVWIHNTFKKLGQVAKLFPRNSKVSTEELIDKDDSSRNKTVLRRVYNLT